MYEHLAGQGFHPNGEAVEIAGWQVQFLAAPDALVEEAIHNASVRDVGGVPVRVMAAPYLVAIMLQTGRQKDFVRIQMFFDQEVLSETGFLQELVRKFNLEQQWEKWQKFKEIK